MSVWQGNKKLIVVQVKKNLMIHEIQTSKTRCHMNKRKCESWGQQVGSEEDAISIDMLQALGNHFKMDEQIKGTYWFTGLKGPEPDQASGMIVHDGIETRCNSQQCSQFLSSTYQSSGWLPCVNKNGCSSLRLFPRTPDKSIFPSIPRKSPKFILIGQDQVTCEPVTASRKNSFLIGLDQAWFILPSCGITSPHPHGSMWQSGLWVGAKGRNCQATNR